MRRVAGDVPDGRDRDEGLWATGMGVPNHNVYNKDCEVLVGSKRLRSLP